MNLIFALQRSRFIWLNLLFVGYLWLLQPLVVQRLDASIRSAGPDWLLGSLLLAIQLVEMVGLLFKRPVGAYFARRYPDASKPGGCLENSKVVMLVFAPIFHLCATAILTLLAFDLWNLTEHDGASLPLQCLSIVLFFVVLTKEAFFVAMMLGIGLAGGRLAGANLAPAPNPKAPPWVDRLNRWLMPEEITQITLKAVLKDLAGDVMLLAFSALTYTAAWDFITTGAIRQQGSERLLEYLGVSLLFFLVYFTTRSVYLMQELSIRQSWAARLASGVSFVVVWLSALWSITPR